MGSELGKAREACESTVWEQRWRGGGWEYMCGPSKAEAHWKTLKETQEEGHEGALISFLAQPKSAPKLFATPRDMHDFLEEATNRAGGTLFNVSGMIMDMQKDKLAIETELFPLQALEFYTGFNLGKETASADSPYYNAARGGQQGDYREGLAEKIDNVVSCLMLFPASKRATITIPYSSTISSQADHRVDAEAKCLRELQFYICDNTLNCTGFMRAQASSIFPKNIHFIGTLMHLVAESLDGLQVGTYCHNVTIFVADRY